MGDKMDAYVRKVRLNNKGVPAAIHIDGGLNYRLRRPTQDELDVPKMSAINVMPENHIVEISEKRLEGFEPTGRWGVNIVPMDAGQSIGNVHCVAIFEGKYNPEKFRGIAPKYRRWTDKSLSA